MAGESMSKFTPGPWEAVGTSVYFRGLVRGGFDIRGCPNSEANARLIAAAPDLLEALKEVVQHLKEDDALFPALHPIGKCPVLEMAKAVIAKAEIK
jgi:hypothetical protein